MRSDNEVSTRVTLLAGGHPVSTDRDHADELTPGRAFLGRGEL